MIKSDIVKIPKIENFDNNYIEKELGKVYPALIRWAIVGIDKEFLTLSVSSEM